MRSLREAISQKAPEYAKFSSNDVDGWQQLNDNVIQIENELYSPIRPKQVAKSLETPTNALESRGVSYLEVRSLDVNPYSPIGIDIEQFYFLDVFLLYCLLEPSAKFGDGCFPISQDNINKTVTNGRDPKLKLNKEGIEVPLSRWGHSLIEKLTRVAAILDTANNVSLYSEAVQAQALKFNDANLTPSGKWLNTLLENQIDNSMLGLELAKEYKLLAEKIPYKTLSSADFRHHASQSIAKQAEIEAADTQDFSSFVKGYFAK